MKKFTVTFSPEARATIENFYSGPIMDLREEIREQLDLMSFQAQTQVKLDINNWKAEYVVPEVGTTLFGVWTEDGPDIWTTDIHLFAAQVVATLKIVSGDAFVVEKIYSRGTGIAASIRVKI